MAAPLSGHQQACSLWKALLTPALVLILGAASACGSARPGVASGTADASPAARLDSLVDQDRRVAEVAWRLATANAPLCPVVSLRTGWTLQSANQYGPALRPLARQRFGLEGDLPGVLATPAGSPAALAGLDQGDLILAVNGAALAVGDASGTSGYDNLRANLTVLNQAAAQGPLTLTVRRDGQVRTVAVRPTPACAYETQIETNDGLSARSDGRHVFISSGLAALTRNDDELAFFLAHELAHAVLEHRTAPDVVGTRGTANSQISLRRGRSSSAEADADIAGLYLLARASYAPQPAVEALTAYEAASPLNRFAQISLTGGDVYRSPQARRKALEPVLADIARRQQASEPLIP